MGPCNRFTPAIEAVNEKLKAYAQLNTKVDFVDCTPRFLEDDDKVAPPLQPPMWTATAVHSSCLSHLCTLSRAFAHAI